MLTKSFTSLAIPSQKYLQRSSSSLFSTPKWPIASWHSCRHCSRRVGTSGMQSRSSYVSTVLTPRAPLTSAVQTPGGRWSTSLQILITGSCPYPSATSSRKVAFGERTIMVRALTWASELRSWEKASAMTLVAPGIWEIWRS